MRMVPEEFEKIFSVNLRKTIHNAIRDFNGLQEIRLRANEPIVIRYYDRTMYLTKDNRLSESIQEAISLPAREIRETMEYISNYSMYAYEEEIKHGYLTINGGHRIGIAGKVICENGKVQGIKHISCLCIRIAHEVIGCSDLILRNLFVNNEFVDTLILSPPGFGKTTLLRDLIRNLSDGSNMRKQGYQLGLVDERSEIASCYLGIPQNNIGKNTDVYDACPKATGINFLVRSMSPEVIAVDEVACSEDMLALEQAFGCGCRILATTHAACVEELHNKRQWEKLLRDKCFQRFVVIEKKEKSPIYKVLNQDGQPIIREGRI